MKWLLACSSCKKQPPACCLPFTKWSLCISCLCDALDMAGCTDVGLKYWCGERVENVPHFAPSCVCWDKVVSRRCYFKLKVQTGLQCACNINVHAKFLFYPADHTRLCAGSTWSWGTWVRPPVQGRRSVYRRGCVLQWLLTEVHPGAERFLQ